MKPYCDRPLCTRQFTHEHAPESPPDRTGGDLSASEPVSPRHTPRNGREAESGAGESAHKLGQDLVERARAQRSAKKPEGDAPTAATSDRRSAPSDPSTSAPPESEDKGGALPEVEAGTPETSPFAAEWEALSVELDTVEARRGRLLEDRKALVTRMRDAGLSFGDIAKLTGVSRQRVSQLAS